MEHFSDMDYIVFDLEWNQSPRGKRGSNKRLPFEIIEIGAVRVNERMEITDSFHQLIKPQVYKSIHSSIHDVIHMDMKDLSNGISFPEAACRFLKWCGNDYIFCTWGPHDVMELQRNMDFYQLLPLIRGPVTYLDVQKIFSLSQKEPAVRCSLEHAIDALSLKKEDDFHRALADAAFTAEVMTHLDRTHFLANTSLDIYQHPKEPEGKTIYGPYYIRHISGEFSGRDQVMRDKEMTIVRCPLCHQPTKKKVRWFSTNLKVCRCLAVCPDHGLVSGKIRIFRTDDDACFGVKTVRFAREDEAKEIQERYETLKNKKVLKQIPSS